MRTITTYTVFVLFLGILAIMAAPTRAQVPNFWSHWGDGKAELNGYKTEIPRYGSIRKGYSVLIFVTEDISKETQVKVDRKLTAGSKVKVMKLNHIKKFRTGIYDYSIMESVFSPLFVWKFKGRGMKAVTPIKTAYSSQEWCGIYYEQINSTPTSFIWKQHSYFDGEADTVRTLQREPYSIFESDLLIRTRELTAPFPSGEYTLLPSSLYSRIDGGRVEWTKAEVRRSPSLVLVKSSLGKIKARTFVIDTERRKHTIWVEGQFPKRIIRWEVLFKESGMKEISEIAGSFRGDYWNMKSADKAYLRKKVGVPVDIFN